MKSLLINQKDLKHNIEIIKELAKDNTSVGTSIEFKLVGVVKGNGYGLGLVEFARFLKDNGVPILAVSTVEEAVELREAGIDGVVLMLSSTAVDEEIKTLIEHNITVTIGSDESARKVNEWAKKLNITVRANLAIDTGFGRYGFLYQDTDHMISVLKSLTNVHIVSTFSHFSMSFAKKEKWTRIQFKRFVDTVSILQENYIKTGHLHICNSSAFLRFPYMHLNAARIGSAFLGRILLPNEWGLKKIGVLHTNITEIKTLPRGFNVGYSNTFKTKRDSKVAIIPVGYHDGFNVHNNHDVYRFRDKLRYIYHDAKDFF